MNIYIDSDFLIEARLLFTHAVVRRAMDIWNEHPEMSHGECKLEALSEFKMIYPEMYEEYYGE